jgi:maleylacetoacetate isomerase
MVPVLEIDGHWLTQSLAICNYLNSIVPEPAFMPADAADRAHVLALALAVACDIHPLNNLRVLKYLQGTFGVDDSSRDLWYRHWIEEGLGALEEMARPKAGAFLFGDAPSLADICLVPQLYNARRFSVPLTDYPTLRRADETASAHAAFAAAHPDRQEQ